jgi:hypothetical protein
MPVASSWILPRRTAPRCDASSNAPRSFFSPWAAEPMEASTQSVGGCVTPRSGATRKPPRIEERRLGRSLALPASPLE